MTGDERFSKHSVSKAIYGSISVLAVLLVMEEHPPAAWRAAVTLFGSALAIALAEAYSETVAEMISRRARLTGAELGAVWRSARPILLAANLPTLFLLLSAAGLYSVPSALLIAEYAVYAALFVYGAWSGRLLHGTWWRSLLGGLFTLAVGALIGLIKYFFH